MRLAKPNGFISKSNLFVRDTSINVHVKPTGDDAWGGVDKAVLQQGGCIVTEFRFVAKIAGVNSERFSPTI